MLLLYQTINLLVKLKVKTNFPYTRDIFLDDYYTENAIEKLVTPNQGV